MLVVLALAACGDNNASVDAAVPIDAAVVVDAQACETFELVSCLGSTARVAIESFDGCAPTETREHTCATACAIEFERMNFGKRAAITFDPVILCAETPAAHRGSGCGVTSFCLPTRAVIASDGTVESQEYIACGEEICISRPPPYIADYGATCVATAYDERDPGRAACYGGGRTEYCVGDWECPPMMLCDDDVGTPRPVCKPGPRGSGGR